MEDVASSGNLPFKVTAVAAGEAHTLLLTGNQLSNLVVALNCLLNATLNHNTKKLVKIIVYHFFMPCFLLFVFGLNFDDAISKMFLWQLN